MPPIDIHIPCPDRATAEAIAQALLERRLVACANIGGPMASLYRWNGAIERAEEVPLALKTRSELFEAVAEAAAALHPYDLPAIHAVEAVAATDAYFSWILSETGA
ncbi:MAG: divalent-cation tolerance protein CutA [Amaricoccus sp.]